jgi:cellulose biosynthesis protein BcsQ
VSKSTTPFALGWMLAEKGYRVVMIDADPQCNLTGLVLGDALDGFYVNNPKQNIHAGLAHAFESQPWQVKAVDCVQVESCSGLFLLPGYVNLSEYEVTLGIAQELSGTIQTLRNLPGAFHYFISTVARANNADFVLVDLNPSLGAINQNFLMSSDYFFVPTSPDYFSVMAIDSLASILPKWAEWARRAHASEILKSAEYPFPEFRLKFLGTVIQKYRPRLGNATVGFQKWIDDINSRVTDRLIPNLRQYGLTFEDNVYVDSGLMRNYCLAQIPDYNTLVATSQTYKRPVFALTDDMFGHVGSVLELDQKKRGEFHDIYGKFADNVIRLIQHA